MPVEAMKDQGFQVDTEYVPVLSMKNMTKCLEMERDVVDTYNRGGHVLRTILDSLKEREEGTIVIITHAPLMDAMVRYLLSERRR